MMNLSPRSLVAVPQILLTALLLACTTSSAQTVAPARSTMKQTLLHQRLHFEAAPDGGMSSQGAGRALRIEEGGSVIFGEHGKGAVSVLLDGANPQAQPQGQDVLAGRTNYLLGSDPAKWRKGVSQFGKVKVPAVYPGVDLVYYGKGDHLEHDYLLAANTDPDLIRMKFQGATARLDAKSGELVLQQNESSEEAIRLEKPVAYQISGDGTQQSVAVSYRLRADGEAQFDLGDYDHARPLVIDPVIQYGTYFGGNQTDAIVDLKVGSDGSIFLLITGDSTDLKTVGAPAKICSGNCGPMNPGNGDVYPDMYVAKLDSTGQTLLFATYLGGSYTDQGINLALDTDGSIYIAGGSFSPDFPLLNGYSGPIPSPQGYEAGTLTKLSADGSTILYSSFIGYGPPTIDLTNQSNGGTAPIMVTANNGIVYLIGVATIGGQDSSFVWKTNALFSVGNDFVAKLDTTKSGAASIVYATQVGDNIGGFSYAQLTSLALDSKGDVWLYGQTSDAAFPKPTAGALQSQCKSTPCSASFLMEIDPTGTSAPYASYLGGSTNGGVVTPRDILIDPTDVIYVSGGTSQSDFPIVNGAFTTFASVNNNGGYASKISADGKTLLYSTFVQGTEIAVAAGGQMAFTGTYGTGLTLKNNLQTTPPTTTNTDAIFGLFDTTLSGANSLLISSYLGTHTAYTSSSRILFASNGQLLIAGTTSATELPVVNPYQATCASCASRAGTDGFIVAIQPNNTLTLTPSTLAFPSTSVGSTSAVMTATLSNGTTKPIYLVQGSLSDSKDFAQTNTCGGLLSPLASCTISITFTPQSAGSLTSTYTTGDLDNQATKLTIALSGNAAAPVVTVSPTNLSFGTVSEGTTAASQSVTLTNGSSSALPITGATVSGAGFALTNNGCGSSVAANSTCQYGVTVSPTSVGALTGSLTITDSFGAQSVQLSVTGSLTAPQSETLSPAVVNFGNVYDSSTATQVVTFTNNGPGPVTFSGAAITPSIFKIVTTSCTTQPVVAGVSCTYTLSFTPFAVGSVQGTFTVTDGSSNPSVTLNATGIQASNGDGVFLLPGAINYPDVATGNYSGPSSNLTFANQTAQTIDITSTHYFISSSSPTPFSMQVGQPFFCPVVPNSLGTVEVPPYTSCSIGVYFDPSVATADVTYNAQLNIDWNYKGDTTLHYMATALTANTVTPPSAVVTPTSIQFPATANGFTSPAQIVTVSSTGDQPVTFIGATFNGTNAGAFAQTNNCPATLNKGMTCQINVTFSPGATGTSFTANLDVSLNTGDVNVTLNGGTSPSDFVLTTPTPLQNMPNPSWTINIAPLTASIGFNQPITFTVSGLDSSFGTPVFTPATVTPNQGSASTTLTLTSASSAVRREAGFQGTALPILACSMVLLLSFRKRLRNDGIRCAVTLMVLALAAVSLNGCSDQKSPVNFTVTATSGAITHTLSLTIQP